MEFDEFALLNLNCLVCKTSFVNKFQRLAGSGDVVKCKYLPNRCSISRKYDEVAVNFEDFVNALDRYVLSLKEIARLWDEFKCPRLFILGAVSVYVTVNNCDLIISRHTWNDVKKLVMSHRFVTKCVDHVDCCFQVCGVP